MLTDFFEIPSPTDLPVNSVKVLIKRPATRSTRHYLRCETLLKNRHAPEMNGANCHAKRRHSKNIRPVMLAQFRSQ